MRTTIPAPAMKPIIDVPVKNAPAYFTSEQIGSLERQRHAIRTQAEHFLSRFGRQHTAVPFVPTVDSRPPLEAILAEASSADLVVMGTHGRH